MRTVAEGIECEQQAAALRKLGCDRGQGYLGGPAVEPDGLTELLRGLGS
jgi:EAL domain-containing protein (putative c-di-GMP-specific phosphodiesterase class I)